MSVTIGAQLGSHELIGLLGKGGMGEVYRARDTKLKREVAIKILPDEFSRDPDRVSRFQREAEVLASLNHPNIAAIYDLQEANGSRFLVLELVEGETLAERIKRGPIPVDESLNIAKSICEALEAAHEKGVVHRDLKPANVKITPDGKVKVLDFGLAKAFETEASKANLSQSPTLSMAATNAGVILGTAAYMSPEQTRGKVVDKRADIWAFGVVLYEMITGKQLFEGEDLTETLASVVKQQPDLSEVPPNVRRVLDKCLQKDPKNRLRDISSVALLLEEAPGAPAQRLSHSRLPWTVAAGLAVAFGIAFWALWRAVPALPEPARFQILPPEKSSFGNALSISPDGRLVAFLVRSPDTDYWDSVWVRSLDTLAARPLAGTEGAVPALFWSPDSRWIGFATLDKLKKVAASGGPPQTVCDFQFGFRGGTWNREGVIIAGTSRTGLFQVPEAGGTPALVTALDSSRQEIGHGNPAFLPDGRHFIYTRVSVGRENSGIYVGSLDTKPEQQDRKRLVETGSGAIYAAPEEPNSDAGYLLFERERSLMAQPFDASRLVLRGEAIPVGEDLNTGAGASYSASATGVLVFRTGSGAEANTRLIWFDRQGKQLGQFGPSAIYNSVYSADGKRVTVTQFDRGTAGISHIWIADQRAVFSRLNPGDTADTAAVLSPDGRIAFTFVPAGAVGDLYWRLANGAGQAELLFKSPTLKHPNHWSFDGRFLIYDDHHPTQRQDLWVIPMGQEAPSGPGRKPIPFLVTPADETFGQFSPDGKWVAYDSDESGRREVYVQGFAPDRVPAAAGGKWTISSGGGHKPRWRRDGKELFYLALDGKMMAVPLKTTAATFEPGVPVPLFETNVSGFMPYDVTPDGRFLINTATGAATPNSSPITVVLNWQARLKK